MKTLKAQLKALWWLLGWAAYGLKVALVWWTVFLIWAFVPALVILIIWVRVHQH